MNNTQVLFIGPLGGDTQVWSYGLGKRAIFSITATVDDVHMQNSVLSGCALVVVDMDESQEQVISFCHYLRSIFDGPILLSTYERDERFHLRLYQAGIDECIVKPIGASLVMAKVMSWLRAEALIDDTDSMEQPFEQ